MRATIALLLGGLVLSTACPDGEHAHEYAQRAEPPVPLTPPLRPLVWGDVNIIHTTDSHGWLLGHQKTSFPEPNYRYVGIFLATLGGARGLMLTDYERVLSGDFGDFASFVAHMKDIANVINVTEPREAVPYARITPLRRRMSTFC